MEAFRQHLKQEFLHRTAKNERYSLRAFASMLELSHASLSGMLSGKRKVSMGSANKIAAKLGWGPELLSGILEKSAAANDGQAKPYYLIQQDAFAAMSEWYFDAILEFTKISGFEVTPQVIADTFGISVLKARLAIETLERLELLKVKPDGAYELSESDTTNILDVNFTSAALINYQKSVLGKSADAIENIPRGLRDHSSTTIAMNRSDLLVAKKMIEKFRHDLDRFLQRGGMPANDVYQLQVSFFPLTNRTDAKDNP